MDSSSPACFQPVVLLTFVYMHKENLKLTVKQFGKAQISSAFATLGDFSFAAVLFHFLHQGEGVSTFFGALLGGLVNCCINYRWTFRGCGQRYRTVFFRYALVWSGSIFLNTWGTVLGMKVVKEYIPDGLDIFMSVKALVAVVVAVLWNFNMQKYFVYKNKKI